MRARLFAVARMARLPEGVEPIAAQCAEGTCHVCGEEEESDDNLLLQCDACRVYVHQCCYGVAEPPDGRLWLCDICTIGEALIIVWWRMVQIRNSGRIGTPR